MSRIWTAMLCVALVLIAFSAHAATYNVDAGQGNGSDMLHAAVKQLQDGDTLVLAPGVYIWPYDSDQWGPVQLVGRKNVTLKSNGEAYVLCTDRYTTPVYINGCNGVTIENIHFGHIVERGYCAGGVVWIENSSDVTLDGCVLHGSGIFAVHAENVDHLLIDSCALVECTCQAVETWRTRGLTVTNCLLARNDMTYYDGDLFNFTDSMDLDVTNNLIADNDEQFLLVETPGDPHLLVENNLLANNAFTLPPEYQPANTEGEVGTICNLDYTLADPGTPQKKLWKSGQQALGPRNNRAAQAYAKFLIVYNREQGSIHQ